MAARHDRAMASLTQASERSQAFLKGLRHQVNDATEIGKEALNGNYTPQKWFADVAALWINGAALVGELYGATQEPQEKNEKHDKGEKKK
jgi:hypothetical protein